jgi:hypothetical protein
MLETFLKYDSNLYQSYEHYHDAMVTKLSSNKSPCLAVEDHCLWYSNLTCPQITADTFKRPVISYAVASYYSKAHDKMIESIEKSTLCPFIDFDIQQVRNPIILIWYNSHYYLGEVGFNKKTGNKKKIKYPEMNFYHDSIVARKGISMGFHDNSVFLSD